MTMAKKDFVQGFYPEFQLEKLVSKDDNRPILNYIYFAHGYAYATDAHVGAKMRLLLQPTLPTVNHARWR